MDRYDALQLRPRIVDYRAQLRESAYALTQCSRIQRMPCERIGIIFESYSDKRNLERRKRRCARAKRAAHVIKLSHNLYKLRLARQPDSFALHLAACVLA